MINTVPGKSGLKLSGAVRPYYIAVYENEPCSFGVFAHSYFLAEILDCTPTDYALDIDPRPAFIFYFPVDREEVKAYRWNGDERIWVSVCDDNPMTLCIG